MNPSPQRVDKARGRAAKPHTRRWRRPLNCGPCRQSKLRCDRHYPCASCKRRNLVASCTYTNPRTDAPTLSAERPLPPGEARRQATPEEPGRNGPRMTPSGTFRACNHTAEGEQQAFTYARWDAVLQRPVQQSAYAHLDQQAPVPQPGETSFPFPLDLNISKRDLLAILPPKDCCDYLISQFFIRLSPLFHILHGPTFQRQYNAFLQNPSDVDLSWLALLFAICSVTLNTIADDDAVLAQLWPEPSQVSDPVALSLRFRKSAMVCLSQDHFLIRHSLNTLESLLILIYTISHTEGVERTWVLLGMTLNIGIALQCAIKDKPPELNCLEAERRRRCWAGILLLHTYQAISFRDINVSALLNIEAALPADVNDCDVLENAILPPSSQPTQMSVVAFKLRLFQLSGRICHHLSTDSRFDESALDSFDAEIAKEQERWNATFLLDGLPSVLDVASYAHWCILQQYAHQLYLLLHRGFCRSRNNIPFRSASRLKCITSGVALIEIHRKFLEVPRLQHYRCTTDASLHRSTFDAAVQRIGSLQTRSPICAKAYPVLHHLQTLLSPEQFQWSNSSDNEFGAMFDEWINTFQWLHPDSIDWNVWSEVLNETN